MFVSLRVCVGRAILVSWFVVMEVCRSCKFVFYTGLLVNGAVVWLWDVIILICVGLYLLAMGLEGFIFYVHVVSVQVSIHGVSH